MTRLVLKHGLAPAVLILALTSPLSAHPSLLKASPGAGESLSVFPAEIRLTFSLSVNPALSRIELSGPSGVVSLGDLWTHPDSASVLIAGISGSLGEGDFTVRWTIVGEDGHPVAGEYPFHIVSGAEETSGPGEARLPPDLVPPGQASAGDTPETFSELGEDPSGPFGVESPIYTLVRWVNFLGIIGALGAVAFGLLVLPLAAFRTGRSPGTSTKILLARVGLVSSGIVLFGAVARLLAQRAALFGAGATINLAQGSGALISTAWGAGWLLQVLAGSTALIGFRLARRNPRAGWGLALLGSLLLSLTPALSGHAVSAEGLGVLPILADTLHVIGAGGWIGSLFVVLLFAFRQKGGEDRKAIPLADLVSAFSPTAVFFVGILVVTGLFSAWAHLGSFGALWGSGYGRMLLLKLGVLAPVLATGAYNALRNRPALAEGKGEIRFQWSAGFEVVVASFVLFVTAILVATPTPLHGSAEESSDGQVAQVVQAFHQALKEGDSAGVTDLLAADVWVLEGGHLETREEYVSHHLSADMAFASAVERVQGTMEVVVEGDVAWAVSSSRTKGVSRERTINSEGAELVVLTREKGQWRIRAVHWSSR